MIKRAKVQTGISREKTRRFILEYLTTHPCVDCGEADPVVLEFDHIAERGDKIFEMGRASQRGVGLSRLKAEIDKCDVRCANCHRRKTYGQMGFTHKG